MNETTRNSQAHINNKLHTPLRLEDGSGVNWHWLPRKCTEQLKDMYMHCWRILN